MSRASAIDTALDRTIVLGWSKIGIGVRRRMPGWRDELPRMEGRTVLVTGATSGLGEAAAERFSALGARVLLLARSREKAEATQQRIARAGANGIDIVECDLDDLDAVRDAARRVREQEERLDVLVHNAGVMPAERSAGKQGHELALTVNVLAVHLFVAELADLMASSAPARVVIVSSGGMHGQKLDVDELLRPPDPYGGTATYARTKRAQVVLAEQWAERLRGRGITVHSMHPGWAATPGVTESMPTFGRLLGPILRTPADGADTIAWLGAADEPARSSGAFWQDRRERPTHLARRFLELPEERERLWRTCVELTGAPADG